MRFGGAPTYHLRLLCRACCLPGSTLGRSAGVEPLEQVAPAMCQSLIMDGISARLPGLLIPSDFSIIFDGVSIESSARARPCKSSMRDLLLSLMLDFDLDCLRLLRREAATRANATKAWCWAPWLLFLEAVYLFPGVADPW